MELFDAPEMVRWNMAISNKKLPAQDNGFQPAKFINYSLSQEQKNELKSTEFSLEYADDILVKLTESNYKVTFSYDDFAECFAAHIVPKGSQHKNAGFILAGRGSTPLKALKQAAYMHWQIFDEDWSEFYTARGREALDD